MHLSNRDTAGSNVRRRVKQIRLVCILVTRSDLAVGGLLKCVGQHPSLVTSSNPAFGCEISVRLSRNFYKSRTSQQSYGRYHSNTAARQAALPSTSGLHGKRGDCGTLSDWLRDWRKLLGDAQVLVQHNQINVFATRARSICIANLDTANIKPVDTLKSRQHSVGSG